MSAAGIGLLSALATAAGTAAGLELETLEPGGGWGAPGGAAAGERERQATSVIVPRAPTMAPASSVRVDEHIGPTKGACNMR